MVIAYAVPKDAKILVKANQKIDFSTALFDESTHEEIDLRLAEHLHIPSSKIFQYLKKFVGEEVHKGDVIAAKKGVFSQNVITSEYSGIVKEINHAEGVMRIRVQSERSQVQYAPFTGEVQSVAKNIISVKVKEGKEFPLKRASSTFGAKTCYLRDSQSSSFEPEHIDRSIVVSEHINAYLLTKFEVLGAKGFVTTNSLPEEYEHSAQIKNLDDVEKIFGLQFPYCFIDKNRSTIVFYSLQGNHKENETNTTGHS